MFESNQVIKLACLRLGFEVWDELTVKGDLGDTPTVFKLVGTFLRLG